MILQEQYYEDLLDCINSTPDTVLWRKLVNKKKLLKDEKLLDRLWTEYQKMIENGVDENYAYAFALEEVLDIPLSRWENIFHRYIEGRHSEFYG